MKVYTVTGLVDEQTGELYVSAVLLGRHDPVESTRTTMAEGYQLVRFLGFFEASSGDEAERIATDVVSHYADDDAEAWSPAANKHSIYRHIEDVDTGGML